MYSCKLPLLLLIDLKIVGGTNLRSKNLHILYAATSPNRSSLGLKTAFVLSFRVINQIILSASNVLPSFFRCSDIFIHDSISSFVNIFSISSKCEYAYRIVFLEIDKSEVIIRLEALSEFL